MLARISHPMHTYLLGREKNQSIRSSADTHTNKHRQRQTWSPNANHWTYISIRTKHTHTGTQMPLDGLTSASKHTTTQQVNRESGTRAYNCQAHTQKKRKGARRDQLNLLPTYFIWCEDQGDVVPLRRDKGSSLTR